jgi:prolyl-tRNA synthetase
MGKQRTAIEPTREQDFPEWYQSVVKGAEMAENSPVRGCMIIKPWGFSIWEKMQEILDKKFKELGHENAYFPLLIPLSFLEKEAEHVDGFAKECAVVTHHRLEEQNGKLIPAGELEEPLIIRPTSETIIGDAFSKWTKSYRDLPILINQWANVMRWEMRTRMFLRTSEFLWQEGHTAHSTEQEAREETAQMLEVYKWFAEGFLAMPVLEGEKTPEEKFPGAENTYTIEAMMQSKKALQAGTSHYLGQNFAKGSDIKFTNKNEEIEYAYTTSWGVSTRLVGGLIMTHSDDDGLVLPPKIAPKHVVILPFLGKGNDEKVLEKAHELKKNIESLSWGVNPPNPLSQGGSQIEVIIDSSDKAPGAKNWDWVRKGIPLRIMLGEKDIDSGKFPLSRRDKPAQEKELLSFNEVEKIPAILEEMQKNIFEKAQIFQKDNIQEVSSLDELKEYFAKEDAGFALCYSDPEVNEDREKLLKELKVTARCIPFEYNKNNSESECIFTGKKVSTKIIYARAY